MARMIDANANRASEAARTLEDIARFVLNDGPTAKRCKSIRHELVRALWDAGWNRTDLAASRDTAGDVGVAHSQADAHHRSGIVDATSAAGSRLTEALRVIEELLKLSSPAAAAAVERLRYSAYDAEKTLLLAFSQPDADWPLCVLISESVCGGRDWLGVATEAVRGGASCIQLREKDLPDRELLSRAQRLVQAVRPMRACVMINDRPDIARLSEADGVHLGQDDLPVSEARGIVGERLLIGVSCSTIEQAREAVLAGADCLGLGPMFASGTKPRPVLAGLDLVRAVLADPIASRPAHLAISGIDATRAEELAAIGCRGIAVSSAVCGADDPRAAAADTLRLFRAGRAGVPNPPE